TNKDMIELSPKGMIPTMYDYWVHDVEVLKEKGKYKLYPHNPYETVINTRPAISFYNDNNPDWLNIMIFYHVLAHIDFFQNNILFKNTWDDDFTGQALADKRLIESLRAEKGRWLDYVIEFSRAINNLVGYFNILVRRENEVHSQPADRISYYFDTFLQEVVKKPEHFIFNEINRFNEYISRNQQVGEALFLNEIRDAYPEFNNHYEKSLKTSPKSCVDVMEYILNHSAFLNKEKNLWMKSVVNIVRNTALYFAPQIRSKTINEGWASYWHDELFRRDDRIRGHEVSYAKINAAVTSVSRVGLNPYAIGLRLFQYIRKMADEGRLNYEFQTLENAEKRDQYNRNLNQGESFIFKIRENFSDFMFLNTFVDQDFVTDYNLFVVGKRLNQQRGTYEYYIKSKKAEDYKKMLIDSLYHPPFITVDLAKSNESNLYLVHKFENKQLVKDFIPDTLVGIEYLWGNTVQLETTEIYKKRLSGSDKDEYEYRKVLYTVKDKKVVRQKLGD
ncbi:MAG: SpoVR family protein, partial [Bacteroidales bacterium]|nr:SpoVR family protein [Bacteroidales bacterium]